MLTPMPTSPETVAAYMKSLPDDRRKALEAVRKAIRANLDPKIKERIQYGMVGYAIPHSVYPNGYHCDPSQPLPFASIASQKNHMAVYLFCLYCDPAEVERFKTEWQATGKKLDMGASCVRFKKLDDVPLDVLGRAIKRMTAKKFIDAYEAGFGAKAAAAKKKTPKKPAAKKTSKKASTKATAPKKTAKKAANTATKKTTSKKPTAKGRA